MRHPFYQWLSDQNLVPDAEIEALELAEHQRPFSLFREVNFLLYAGVLIVCSGLGILIYNNIDTIGHLVLIIMLFLASAFSILFSHYKYAPFTTEKNSPPRIFYPYLVLLGISLFLLWEGYIEYQYELSDGYYQIPTLLAALVCFSAAYRFDHEGVLSIALTTLVASIGLSILPQKWFLGGVDFNQPLFSMGVVLGISILILGYMLAKRKIKAHFENTYANVGGFLLLVCLLGLQFDALPWLGFFTLAICFGLFLYARQLKSVGLYVLLVLLGYCAFFGLLQKIGGSDLFAVGMFYMFPLSIGGVGYLLLKYKHFLQIS